MAPKESLVKMLGEERVIDDPKILASYAETRSFGPHFAPWLAVRPDGPEAVERLVGWANESRTPLVPVSSKGLKIRGDSVPSVPEAVVVDLSDMKKILSVNRQHRIAVVEPGVTYGELNAALAEENMVMPMSLRPKAGKSVMTDVLEGEPRLNPMVQWSYYDPLRCMEVTWGEGVRMFTGEAAAGARDLESQWADEKWQVNVAGPFMLDFYRVLTAAQGSMGIVTWASLKCAVKPLLHRMFVASANSLSELEGFVYRAMWTRFPDEIFIMNRSQLASLLGKTSGEIAVLKPLLPPWTVAVGVAGRELLPEERFEARSKDLTDIAQENGLDLRESIDSLDGDAVLREASSACVGTYWKDLWAGSSQSIFFVTQLERAPLFLKRVTELAESLSYPVGDIGVYIQPKHLGSAYHMEFTLPYDPDSARETRLAEELFDAASREIAGLGGYYSRPYGKWAGIQLNKDAQSLLALKRIQGIFDPNGIMNPGKLAAV
ncbi:MAG: FAD-binding oxidoreductase [Clostridiales Family XIII bacterium]|nr:FAD-binding oxidoreductase [Clostridiales Family XIII bacterium]